MAVFTVIPLITLPPPSTIGTNSPFAQGQDIAPLSHAALTSKAWTSVNRAFLFRFKIPFVFTVRQLFLINGNVVAGNIDLGVYDTNFSLLRSIGSTAQAGTNAVQAVAVSALKLQPGEYWCALAMSLTTGQTANLTLDLNESSSALDTRLASASFPLPLTIDPAQGSQSILPLFGMYSHTS